MNTFAATATSTFATNHGVAITDQSALVHGYAVTFYISAGLLASTALVVAFFIRVHKSEMPASDTAMAPA